VNSSDGGYSDRISLVIPAFDVEDWIEGAIGSVTSQPIAIEEIIVVNDGSTDRTGAVAESIQGARVINQPNLGPSAARNKGIDAATGDLVLLLDADDRLVEGALDGLTTLARAHPEASVFIPNHLELRQPPGPSWPMWSSPRVLERADLRELIRRNWLRANCLVRLKTARRIRFDERFRALEDILFFSEALLAGEKIVVSGEPGVEMQVMREGSATSRQALVRRSRRLVYEELLTRPELGLLERATLIHRMSRSGVGEVMALRSDDRSLDEALSLQGSSRSLSIRLLSKVARVLMRPRNGP
jgi:glycosyltransferase involved in cell wall biosynthesis